MCNSEDSRVFEALVYELLDVEFCDYVDIGSCFIKDDNLILAKDRPADANKLPFSSTDVRATICEFHLKKVPETLEIIDVIILLVQKDIQIGRLYHTYYVFFFDFISWIQVEFKGAVEDNWVLWDHCYRFAQFLQAYLRNVNSVDQDFPRFKLHNASKSETDG